MMLLTIEDEKFAEGRAAGRAEGRAEGLAEGQQLTQHEIYKRLVDVYKVSPQEAAAMTGWNINFSYGMN